MLIGNIYRSPNSVEENDNELYELLNYLQNKFKVTILITGDFNYSHIEWYQDYGHGASAKCLSDNDMKFINTLRQHFFLQHITNPTRQRGTDVPHILDLVISSDDFVSCMC